MHKLGDCDDHRFAKTHLKGKYYVVDPCYIVPDHLWGECALEFWDWDATGGRGRGWIAFDLEGHQILAFGTAYGDGVYSVKVRGDEIGSCGVDSGSLSFVPKELFDKDWDYRDHPDTFDSPLVELDGEIELHEHGYVSVGDISVDTRGADADENEEDEI